MHVVFHKVFVPRKIGILRDFRWDWCGPTTAGHSLAMPLAMRPWHPCRKWTLLIITSLMSEISPVTILIAERIAMLNDFS